MMTISASIDLSRVDWNKTKLHRNSKRYYNVQIVINDFRDPDGSDVTIHEYQNKQQREKKQPKRFLGKGRVMDHDSRTETREFQ